MSRNGLEPLSIESLLRKQSEEKEAASKPIFLRKEQRAQIAIERRSQEVRADKEKYENKRKEREVLEREAGELGKQHNQGGRYGGSGRYDDRDRSFARDKPSRRDHQSNHGRDYQRRDRRGDEADGRNAPPPAPPPPARKGYQNVSIDPRADRGKPGEAPSTSMLPPPPSGDSPANSINDFSNSFVPSLSETDLSAIRARYRGVDKKKRKSRKTNERKFVFDWDAQDDTFADDLLTPSLGDESNRQTPTAPGQTHLVDATERRIQKAYKQGYDDRLWTEKPLEEMKERDWRIFKEDFSISTRGGNIPHPLRTWKESEIPESILECIERIGYKEPSPIQRQAIPIGLQNRDIIGIAETGSGKTAAFVIPMLAFIGKLPIFTDENRHLGPYALIMAPTRELAQQIESEVNKFASPLGYKCVSIVGGRAFEEQQFNLREGVEIIVATPGRLKDVLERHVLVLSQCRYIVMDEADRMVHLGFEVDLKFILDALPTDTMIGEDEDGLDRTAVDGDSKQGRTRVTTLFSATMPPTVERLARKYLRKPATITVGDAGRAVDTVEQRVEFVNGDEKKKHRVLEILNSSQYPSPIIVFVNQRQTADMVAKDLSRGGWRTAALHSGKKQEGREAALRSLRSGEADVLVATDLAGRGIDVQDVSLVINYQMAGTIEAYVHRIGRTGRAGKLGTAITFLTKDDDEVMYDLKQEISKSPVSMVPTELAKHKSAQHRMPREMKRKREAEE
ncbi:pre-mRNA-splicing ATP-dependent RNA helicase PRP28 [Ephemerocybe angulata]|uniref:RNA helicase n=1 Tax=Ephemerocybe angulata TaxID=980116 RepID=A0A8H6MAV6_9AGAR|nr:pre-mRNA-splicing ATP-dependent RNA helicase PRP28 [Tulosesus angulatus]